MRTCPYCGAVAYPNDIRCRKCEGALVSSHGTVYSPPRPSFAIGPDRAHEIRRKALAFVVIGLMIKIYWGGYGPWPVVDDPTLVSLKTWLEPLFIYGGAAGYVAGWVLRWF